MLFNIDDEKRVLNYLLNNPSEADEVKSVFFSKESRAFLKTIKDMANSSSDSIQKELMSTNAELLKEIQKKEYRCDNIDVPLNALKKAYLVRREVENGNQFVIDKYTVAGKNFVWDFDAVSLQSIAEEIHRNNLWIDALVNSGFDPFKGYVYTDIPGADQSIDWLVDNLFQTGTFNLAIGPAKSGKSQLCYELAFSLQNGLEFFRNNTKKSKVLYVDWELRPKEIRYRFELLNKFFKLENPEYPLMVPLFRSTHTIDEVVKGVKKSLLLHPDVDVIFYDNFYSFFSGNPNDSSEVKDALKAIQSVSQTATIFLVCHNNKLDGKDGGSNNPIYAAAGSNAFAGFADEFISIINRYDGRIVKINGRHVSPTKEVPCRFCEETYWQFQEIMDEQEILKLMTNCKSREELEELYPELSKFIGDDGQTLAQIQIMFPEENTVSLKQKGFFMEKNKDRLRDGFRCGRFYLENPRK